MGGGQLECPVFRPTLEEVLGSGWEAYIDKIERKMDGRGIAKIVAPAGAGARNWAR